MSNTEAGYGAAQRTPRQGLGGSPVGSGLSILLAVIAVIAGFLILRNITDDGGSADGESVTTPGDTDANGTTPVDGSVVIPDTTTTTTTTTIPQVFDGASVVVANANTVGGSAGLMSDSLELEGYSVETPVNATGPNILATIVYFDPAIAGAEAVANSVARDLGGLAVEAVGTPALTESGDLGDAGVLVLLGDDQAGQTLEELNGSTDEAADEDQDSAAAPDPSDGDVPATAPADADTGGDEEE